MTCCHISAVVSVTSLSGDAPAAGGADVVEQLLGVLAHPRLLVMAGHVVPDDAVLVEVVEDADAALLPGALAGLAVVGLRSPGTPRGRPVGVAVLLFVGGPDLLVGAGPEPPVDHQRLSHTSLK